VVVTGLETLLNGHTELRIAESTDSLLDALDVIRKSPMDLVVLDKAFGIRGIGEFLTNLKEGGFSATPGIVVWGAAISPGEASQFLHAGVRGVHLKTAELSSFIACLRTVAVGRVWMEESILLERRVDYPKNGLTAREQQVLELLQQGLSNRAIAEELQIKPGTVKIHMKHLFEKTGIRGRHSLALATTLEDAANQFPRVHSAVA
jgi:two-component system nitrate/nitrite response regulator NarL